MSLLTGLIHAWRLDGNANDALGADNGVATGITWGAGKLGQCGIFPGSNPSGIAIASALNFQTVDWTLAAWIKTTTAGAMVLFETFGWLGGSSYAGWVVETDASGLINLYTGFGGGITTLTGVTPINDGNWHHVAVTMDSAASYKRSIYVDGVLDATASGLSYQLSTSVTTLIGVNAAVTGGSAWWNGRLDEILHYSRALSGAEIASHWNGGAGFDVFTPTGPAYTFTRFGSMLAKLLPPGVLWDLEAASPLRKMLMAMGDEFTRVEARAVDLLAESDPRTATETIADWERVMRLPDDQVTTIPGTLAGRRVAVAQKLVGRQGANYAFYATLAAACGYPLISITRYANAVTRSGILRSGDHLSGVEWAYAITITVSPATAGALTHAQFEAVINRVTHSHIQVFFIYT